MTDITIPPLDLLEDIAAELARCASGAGDRVNARALNKAALHLPALHAVLRFSAGDLLIPSATTTNQVYRVSGAGCSCAAVAAVAARDRSPADGARHEPSASKAARQIASGAVAAIACRYNIPRAGSRHEKPAR